VTNVSDFATAISSAVSATKRGPMMTPKTHPTVTTLPWFANRQRRPNPIDPLPFVFLPFELFAWQLTLNVTLLTLALI